MRADAPKPNFQSVPICAIVGCAPGMASGATGKTTLLPLPPSGVSKLPSAPMSQEPKVLL